MIPLQTASRHPVSHILFGPDGGTVAVAQPHYGVTILERATGRALAVCALPRRAALTGLTFCGDGKYLATSHAKGLEIFETSTGRSTAATHYGLYRDLRLADRGGEVLGANTTGVRFVWTPYSTFGAGFLQHTTSQLGLVDALSADGRFAILGSSHWHEMLFSLESNRMIARLDREERYGGKTVAHFCPLGRRCGRNGGDVVAVYDLGALAEEDEDDQPASNPLVQRANGQQTTVAPRPHTRLAPVFVLKPDKPSEEGRWYPPFALLADGRGLLVKRPRNRIQLWDAPTGALLHEWSWRLEWVTCVAVSGDGLTAGAGGRFGRVLIWDLE
jgi:hypothetical protein